MAPGSRSIEVAHQQPVHGAFGHASIAQRFGMRRQARAEKRTAFDAGRVAKRDAEAQAAARETAEQGRSSRWNWPQRRRSSRGAPPEA